MVENKNAKTPTDDGQPVAWITNGGKGELWWHQSSKSRLLAHATGWLIA